MAPQVPKGQHILHVCSAYFNRWRISPIFQWNSVSDCRNHASSTFQPDLQTVLHTEKRRQVEKQLNKQRSLGITNKAKPSGFDSNCIPCQQKLWKACCPMCVPPPCFCITNFDFPSFQITVSCVSLSLLLLLLVLKEFDGH